MGAPSWGAGSKNFHGHGNGYLHPAHKVLYSRSMKKRSAIKLPVRRTWLLVLAGLVWSGVGLALCKLAWYWLAVLPAGARFFRLFVGASGAMAAWRFAFSAIAQQNIARIGRLSEKQSLFAFQSPKSYLIIIFMIGLGAVLRHSPVPKSWLAVVYAVVGGALLLASFHYYHQLMSKSPGGISDR